MKNRQRGVTMIGWIFLLIPMAIVLYAGMRVVPEYLNYYKVIKAMSETATQMKSDESKSMQTIQNSLGKRFEVGYIDRPLITDIKISKGEKGWAMTADYEELVPLFANVHLLLAFKKTVDIN